MTLLYSYSLHLTVHELSPGDIKVMGAMGDSLTAGNGIRALTPIGCLTEFRGHSWTLVPFVYWVPSCGTFTNMHKRCHFTKSF